MKFLFFDNFYKIIKRLFFLKREIKKNKTPHIGWKQNLFGYSMIEFYFGYRMKITDVDDIYFSKNIINNRFEYSISLKFNFKKIWQKISK